MKTKNIFKTLVLAAVLVSACGKNEIADDFKGYALPVTINVTRQGDEGTTRATYNESTRKLSFSAGDKLFVQGSYNEGAYIFAGMLDYVSDGKFSGIIMRQTDWTGTIEELLSADGGASATLLPAGYGEYGYLSIADEGTYGALLSKNPNKAFATSKATAVEQFSWEDDNEYSSGFELTPVNAILNFTINGLDASTEVDVSFSYPNYPDPIVISGKVTTDGDGTATFAIGIIYGNNLKDCTLTVDGYAIALPDKEVEAGKIYNISRPVHGVFWNSTDISGIHTSWEGGSVEIGGITFACDGNVEFNGSGLYSMSGAISFTSSLGNIKKIEIKHSGLGSWYGAEGFPGWPSDYDAEGGTFTWEGTPTDKVELPENTGWGQIEGITSILFTLE